MQVFTVLQKISPAFRDGTPTRQGLSFFGCQVEGPIIKMTIQNYFDKVKRERVKKENKIKKPAISDGLPGYGEVCDKLPRNFTSYNSPGHLQDIITIPIGR